ncbi:MAG: YaeQ family protein, partial [Deltaproteobacteria bacterium]|nr:YaeQ family protein [Deltaproteobacteria bacterium]
LYGGRGAELWWQRNADKLQRFANLCVMEMPEVASKALTSLVHRSMQLQCTVQGDEIWLSGDNLTQSISLRVRKSLE